DKVVYLGPEKGGDPAYRLLSAAMRETGLSALGRYAARGKQYLVLLSPMRDGIVMEQLRYAHEVRSFDDVPIGEADVKDQELKLAVQLIDQIRSEQFQPEKYQDEVRERQLELIQAKVQGEDITAAQVEAPQTQIIDLMAALKASLAKKDVAADEESGRKPVRAAKTAKKAAKRRASGG